MHRRTVIAVATVATVATACAVSSPATAGMGVTRAAASGRIAAARGPQRARGPVGRPSRPVRADWLRIKAAAGLRRLALAPHRSSHFRSVAATLGLSELAFVAPLAPGRCQTAVIDLYDNLLDLENAYPGENWGPLRRAVAREPSINACAPRSTNGDTV